MKRIISSLLLLFVFSSSSIAAEIANCIIKVTDYNHPNYLTYTTILKFRVEKKTDDKRWDNVQRMKFNLPGTNNYICTLAFVRLGNGTQLQCRYMGDRGHTFFDSDRTLLSQDKDSTNNLLFRHKTTNVAIKTKCM